MPALPFARFAEMDVRKLRDYCLRIDHPIGQHKARVFQSTLGLTAVDAEWLRGEILGQLPFQDAVPMSVDEHGARFRVDMLVTRLGRQSMIRTAWIVAPETDVPRFVSCWVL